MYTVKALHRIAEDNNIKDHKILCKHDLITLILEEEIQLFGETDYVDLNILTKKEIITLLDESNFKVTINDYYGLAIPLLEDESEAEIQLVNNKTIKKLGDNIKELTNICIKPRYVELDNIKTIKKLSDNIKELTNICNKPQQVKEVIKINNSDIIDIIQIIIISICILYVLT